MGRTCCCTNPKACKELQKRLTALKQHHMVGFTLIPKEVMPKPDSNLPNKNLYRSSIIRHLRLKGLNDDSKSFVALSHWHPAVLELHRKKRLEVALAQFPRWLSFELGKEIGLTHNQQIKGASCKPTTYSINVPSATFASYNDYLSTKFVDDQIVSMASGERSVPLGIRLSLSTSAREKSAQDAPNLLRLSSVQQRSSFVSAELLQEGRALVDKKSKGQMRKDEEARYVSIIAVKNESERDIIKEAEMKIASLKRQADEMVEESVPIDEETTEARKVNKKMKKITNNT